MIDRYRNYYSSILNKHFLKLEEEVEEWLMRRGDDEIDQSDEMGRELKDMLNRLRLLCDERDGLSLELEFSSTDILYSLR